MVKPKKKRVDLNPPQFLKDRWVMGRKEQDAMAELLKKMNFDKEGNCFEGTPMSLWQRPYVIVCKLGRNPFSTSSS